jgi:hypothetical protein
LTDQIPFEVKLFGDDFNSGMKGLREEGVHDFPRKGAVAGEGGGVSDGI